MLSREGSVLFDGSGKRKSILSKGTRILFKRPLSNSSGGGPVVLASSAANEQQARVSTGGGTSASSTAVAGANFRERLLALESRASGQQSEGGNPSVSPEQQRSRSSSVASAVGPTTSSSPGNSSHQWVEGKIVGVPSPTEFSVEAASDGQQFKVLSGDVLRFPTNRPFEDLHDLADLSECHSPGLGFTLERRFRLDLPYSELGPRMLVAINPYKWGVEYDTARGVPHPSTSVGARVLAQLEQMAAASSTAISEGSGANKQGFSQDKKKPHQGISIICTGTSGAGKTESTKMILRELTATNRQGKATSSGATATLDRIQASHAIFELFGNARTALNGNSSRYARYLLLTFDSKEAVVQDGAVHCMLLETARLTDRKAGEGNFHILHALFEDGALSADERKEFELWDSALFPAVAPNSPGDASASFSHSLPYTVQDLRKCFTTLGMSEEQQTRVFRILAGILHLLRVEFTSNDPHSPPTIASSAPLELASRLLGFVQAPGSPATAADSSSNNQEATTGGSPTSATMSTLEGLLTRVILQIGNRREAKLLNRATAVAHRDSLVRSLYESLFDYLVAMVNLGVNNPTLGSPSPPLSQILSSQPNSSSGSKSSTRHVGILDIFGFETVPPSPKQSGGGGEVCNNDLEQLIINYTNEEMQHLYYSKESQAFKEEAEVEGVDVSIGGPLQQSAPSTPARRQSFIGRASSSVFGGENGGDAAQNAAAIAAAEAAANQTASQDCIDAFTKKGNGILSLISDESTTSLSSATAKNLVDKICQAWMPKYPRTVKRQIKDPETFLISHFCEPVIYSALNLATKNRISVNAVHTMSQQMTPGGLSRKLLERHVSGVKLASSRCGSTNSGLVLFQSQLIPLLEHLKANLLYWVRCIKPNNTKSPTLFQHDVVLKQLEVSGVVKTIADLSEGFSVRIPLKRFYEIVKPLMKTAQQQEGEEAEKAKTISELAKEATAQVPSCANGRVRLGITLAFMTRQTLQEIEDMVATRHLVVARIIQSAGRGLMARLDMARYRKERQKQLHLAACRLRIEEERPAREELERDRAQLHQHQAVHAHRAMLQGISRVQKVMKPLFVAADREIQLVNREFEKAAKELEAIEDVRLRAEFTATEQEEYLEYYARQADQKKQKEIQEKLNEQKRKEDLLLKRNLHKSLKQKAEEEAAAKEAHRIRLVTSARAAQQQQQLDEELVNLEEQRERRRSEERVRVRSHIHKAEVRLLERNRIQNEQKLRLAIEAEVLAQASADGTSLHHKHHRQDQRKEKEQSRQLMGGSASMSPNKSYSRIYQRDSHADPSYYSPLPNNHRTGLSGAPPSTGRRSASHASARSPSGGGVHYHYDTSPEYSKTAASHIDPRGGVGGEVDDSNISLGSDMDALVWANRKALWTMWEKDQQQQKQQPGGGVGPTKSQRRTRSTVSGASSNRRGGAWR